MQQPVLQAFQLVEQDHHATPYAVASHAQTRVMSPRRAPVRLLQGLTRFAQHVLFLFPTDRCQQQVDRPTYLRGIQRLAAGRVQHFRLVARGQPHQLPRHVHRQQPQTQIFFGLGRQPFQQCQAPADPALVPADIKTIVQQQFEVAGRILDTGLVPIIEPEVDIHCPQKARAEALLKEALLAKLNGLPAGQQVMLKLTLPEQADFYADCVRHPKVVRVLALSGGYTQDEADARLRKNHGVVASFSRALLEGLSVHQTDAAFNATLEASIQRIYEASIT